MSRVLICDDETAIADIIKFNLTREGYEADTCSNGEECLEILKENEYDLLILDVMMPKLDGFETLRELRKFSYISVIMLTAKDDEVDRVLGLELGADDYVVKPFSMRELIARVRANLRRREVEVKVAESEEEEIMERGDLEIDLERYLVKKRGKTIELTLREFELLKFLAQNEGKVFSREELLSSVWGYEYFGDIRTVDVTVRRLREKIEDKDKDYRYIVTVRGVGYYFGG